METDDTLERTISDELLNESLVEPAGPEPKGDAETRAQWLADYEATSLANAGPMEGLIACANADLMDIAFSLSRVLKNSFASDPLSAEMVRQLDPVLNSFLRVTRQFDRFANLEMRLANARAQAQELKSRSHAGMLGYLPSAARRPR